MEVGGDAGFVQNLNQNFDVILEELRALRAEQRELRQQLEGCGCGMSSGKALREESGTDTASDDEDVGAQQPAGEGGDASALINIDIGDTAELKRVLFGGAPWVIHCKDTGRNKFMSPPSILEESAQQFQSIANFGTIDCWDRTASGKTLAHRFDLPKPPVVFAVANGDPPLVVDMEGVKKPWHLRRKVQAHLQASVARIDGPKSFRSFCTSRRACLVVGYKAAPLLAESLQLLNPLLEKHRGVRAVAVDTAVWKVHLDKDFVATKPKKAKGEKDQAELVCITHQAGANPWRGSFFKAVAESAPNEESVDEFLGHCDAGNGLVPISHAPKISLRPPDKPKPYYPPSSNKSSPKKNDSSKKSKKDPAGSSSSSKKEKRSQRPPAFSIRDRAARKKKSNTDRVGSRNRLEQEEEPLFETVDDDGDKGDFGSDEEPNDDDAEEVEL